MHQEGAIVLGTGGDNSNGSMGSFFEGVMTSGYPTDAADNAVQANIVSVGYSGATNVPDGAARARSPAPAASASTSPATTPAATAPPSQLWDCQAYAEDQHWTHNADDSLCTLGRCLDIDGNGTANGTQVELWDCNGVGGQKWVQQADGSLLNPQSGRCLDSPSGATANGTRLQIWDCNGAAAQKFAVNGGGPIAGPGGKCVDVAGDDTGGNGTAVQLWDCQSLRRRPALVPPRQRLAARPSAAASTSTATARPTAPRSSCGTATASAARCGSSRPTARCSTRSPGRCLDSPERRHGQRDPAADLTCNGTGAQKFALS